MRLAAKNIIFIIFILIFQQAYAGLPKRLILSVDGVSYYDIKKLQKGGMFINSAGKLSHFQCFNDFHQPSKNIAPYPSLSDVAWNDIFQLVPIPGYQRYYYSTLLNQTIGIEGLSEMGQIIEYERLQHWKLEGSLEHLMGYLLPMTVFEREMEAIKTDFFKAYGIDDFYAYIVTSDDIQHMNGNTEELLCLLDRKLKKMQEEYNELTGSFLKIVLLSDHGNNKAAKGIRVKTAEHLLKNNFKITESLQQKGDVILPTSGILNVIEAYAADEDVLPLVESFKTLDGVDVITYIDSKQKNKVYITNPKGKFAQINFKEVPLVGNFYSYIPIIGDPLLYAGAYKELMKRNALINGQFASEKDWFEVTKNHYYPVALERIYRGHYNLTLNPANILVSLKNGYEHADRLTKTMSKITSTGGTHGGLDDLSTSGIVVTNYTKLPPALMSNHVSQLFNNFQNAKNYRAMESGARLITLDLLARSKRETKEISWLSNKFSRKQILAHFWSNLVNKAKLSEKLNIKLFSVKSSSMSTNYKLEKESEVLLSEMETIGLKKGSEVYLDLNLFLPVFTDNSAKYFLEASIVKDTNKIETIGKLEFNTTSFGEVATH